MDFLSAECEEGMQVTNEPKFASYVQNDKPLLIKEGEIFHAVVKERLPNDEAILQIKGEDVRVKIQGHPPLNGKVVIEITDTDEPIPVAKVISETNPALQQIKTGPLHLAEGINLRQQLRADVKRAVDILIDKGIPVTKNTFMQLASFIEKGFGSIEQKLETIASMANKRLEFSPVQIKAVHKALHGTDFSEKLNDLISEIAPEKKQSSASNSFMNEKVFMARQSTDLQESINQIRRALQESKLAEAISLLKKIDSSVPENIKKLFTQAEQLYRAGSHKILEAVQSTEILKDLNLLSKVKNLIQHGESIRDIVNFLRNQLSKEVMESSNFQPSIEYALKLENFAKTSLLEKLQSLDVQNEPTKLSNLQLVINALKKEPDIQKIFAMIKNELIPSLPHDQSYKLKASLTKAVQYAETGRELASRQELMATISQIQTENIDQAVQQQGHALADIYKLNDEFISSLPIQSKDFIVTSITKNFSQMAIDFKEVKRDITKNLQTIQTLIDQLKTRAIVQAKPLLEATIKQLDKAILKSDVMLYTDMETEKKLLRASSLLAEAKKLLQRGDYAQASKIVHDVKNTVDKLMFKPSDIRVKHFVSKHLFQLEQPSLPKQLVHTIHSSMQAVKDVPSARQVYEHLKNLGLTYEADQAHSLVLKGQSQEGSDSSIKGILLKLIQSDAEHPLLQKAEQLVTQLTGQQLLSKTDTSTLQSMMFTLPFLLQDKTEQVKIFVNSKNDQQKVDWENCSLYFLLETKKLGEVGIMLSSVDRTLSITIKNDKPDFKEKIEPLALKAKERLKEIGYNIGTIQFTKLSNESGKEEPKKQVKPLTLPKFTERGYDFTV